MSIEIRLPTALRAFADKQETVKVDAATVGDALESLFKKHDRLRQQLMSPDGKLRSFVNVYVNDDDVRFEQGLETATPDGAGVSIIPAVAGG